MKNKKTFLKEQLKVVQNSLIQLKGQLERIQQKTRDTVISLHKNRDNGKIADIKKKLGI